MLLAEKETLEALTGASTALKGEANAGSSRSSRLGGSGGRGRQIMTLNVPFPLSSDVLAFDPD
jgi:hypothetical protein